MRDFAMNNHLKLICCRRVWCVALLGFAAARVVAGERPEPPAPAKHQITGLFSKDREDDLRAVVKQLPDIKLVSIDFDNAEASFEYDAAKVFPGAKPEQIVERLDNLLKHASRHTFGAKPLCATPREKLVRIDIPVMGLDCKGCSLAAYDVVYRIEGVERATASFKLGVVTAWTHPDKTNRAAIEDALRKQQIPLKTP
jgi:copper chaperone CopZ